MRHGSLLPLCLHVTLATFWPTVDGQIICTVYFQLHFLCLPHPPKLNVGTCIAEVLAESSNLELGGVGGASVFAIMTSGSAVKTGVQIICPPTVEYYRHVAKTIMRQSAASGRGSEVSGGGEDCDSQGSRVVTLPHETPSTKNRYSV